MNRIRNRAAAAFTAALSIGLVACGGGGGGDEGAATAAVVGILTEMIVEEGMSSDEAADMIDADCIADVIGQLSGDDVQELIDNGSESELSADGDATMEGVVECITLPE